MPLECQIARQRQGAAAQHARRPDPVGGVPGELGSIVTHAGRDACVATGGNPSPSDIWEVRGQVQPAVHHRARGSALARDETRGRNVDVQALRVDGWTHPDFYPVARTLRRLLASYGGGAAVCVFHRGEPVVDLWGGVRTRAGAPWMHDTMAPSFSTTKGVASTLLHMMVDRGLLDYDDPVCRHWPEFAAAGKERITVRHVLAHQSGLYHIRQMIDHADRMRDWKHRIRVIERSPPIHAPGTRTGYHGLTYGFLVGEILQRVTGRSFSRLVREELAEPLCLDGMFIGAPREALWRAAELLWTRPRGWTPRLPALDGMAGQKMLLQSARALQPGLRLLGVQLDVDSILDALAPRGIRAFDFGSAATLRAAIPAANGLFTARSLARMYAVLAAGGTLDGVRLLSRRTLSRATRVQPGTGERVVIPWDMRWRLGYHSVATLNGIPRKAFGHFGFGGSGAWADPERNLAVALIVNSGLGTPLGDLRIVCISGVALCCADRRAPRVVTAAAAPARRRERAGVRSIRLAGRSASAGG
jgi:CubicO group peptidase (beta-lactamase class C family)